MAELVLSALLTLLFEKLASSALKNYARYKGIDAQIKKCRRSLEQIQDVLADASRKETTSRSVKRWLNDLQHLAYDIDDVLDGWVTDALHPDFTRESEAIASKVRKLIPTCCTKVTRSMTMHDKLDGINAELEYLVKLKDELGLRVPEEETRPKNRNRRLQTSIVVESSIVGRQAEKEALVNELLGDGPSNQNFSIVPIVGLGGVGKTTLARLLYEEERIKKHFEHLRAWVCVSDDFDIFAISKIVFESVTKQNKNFADLNLLQVALRDHLMEKRFLLVLDDVWSESYEDWQTLVAPFYSCAPGSKIIITARKEQLLRKLGCNHLKHLQSLSDEDALSLLVQHALGVDNFDKHLSLKPYGEGIMKKCDGLPLALVAVGRLLRTKKDEEEDWNEVLNSETWRLQDEGGIAPALRLSYLDLSACLKQLFAYCSLFPKDFTFDKDELVLLWMAEGFLHRSTSSDPTEESLGREYFDELLSRSFFQHAPNNKSLFVMHDLATSVAVEFFLRFDNEAEKDIQTKTLEKYRHMSFVREEYAAYQKFETFKKAKCLRTFLATYVGEVRSWQRFHFSHKILAEFLPELPRLRVLSLSGFNIREVPESIGTLRHLRYLNLSRAEITCLPENVCNLYNLETLILFGCSRLVELPNNVLKLKNLGHLDIRNTPDLNKMPLGIGELKCLQTLSKIIIGGESGFEITKLKELKNLCGEISILGLEEVHNAIHAREANFSEKKISGLEVIWSDVSDGSRNAMLEKDALNELKPRNNYLKHLKIESYGGLEFPIWVGDPSFLQLKHVSIRGCKKCKSLPPLAQLPSLKELGISGLDGLKVVGLELLGTRGAFPSLEFLSFENMPGWEKWTTNSGVVSFPCLKRLHIYDCPNLVEVTVEALPSLNILNLRECDKGVLRRVVQVASAVSVLSIDNISGLDDLVWRGVTEDLRAVEELSISRCNEIRYLWESEAAANKFLMKLRRLEVSGCDNLVSLGEKEVEDNCRSNLLTSLRSLDVRRWSVAFVPIALSRRLSGIVIQLQPSPYQEEEGRSSRHLLFTNVVNYWKGSGEDKR